MYYCGAFHAPGCLRAYCIHNHEAILRVFCPMKTNTLPSAEPGSIWLFLIISWKDNSHCYMHVLLLTSGPPFPNESESVTILFWLFPLHLGRASFLRYLLHKMFWESSVLSLGFKNIPCCFPFLFVWFSGIVNIIPVNFKFTVRSLISSKCQPLLHQPQSHTLLSVPELSLLSSIT